MRVDLHIHTTASDGCWTPEEVVAGVQAEGIGMFAVTDHDTVGNVLTTEALAQEAGLAFLRGVEISTTADGRLFHILGYGIDPTDARLLAALKKNQDKLESTDDHDIRQLIALGYDIEYDDYLAYDYDRRRGGFKSLRFLIDRGICADVGDFFETIRAQLNHHWPNFIHPREAVRLIQAAGGAAVLAHPGASLEPVGGVRAETLAPFLAYGIEGVECHSQYHDGATTQRCVDWCREHDLLITGGSDYHGGFVHRALGKPEIALEDLHLGRLTPQVSSVQTPSAV